MPMSSSETDDLISMLKVARKQPINFGLCLASDPKQNAMFLHRTKSVDILMKSAKKAAGSSKTTQGTVDVSGKVVTLNCEIDPPAGIERSMKQFLADIGFPSQIVVNLVNAPVAPAVPDQENTDTAASDTKAAAPAPAETTTDNGDAKEAAALKAKDSRFQKTRTLWATSRTKIESEMKKLESAIKKECAADPELAPIIAELPDVMAKLNVFDGELDKRIADLIGVPEGSSKDSLKAQARATVQEYETALLDPFFVDVDGNNGFTSVAVTGTAKQALKAISKVLV